MLVFCVGRRQIITLKRELSASRRQETLALAQADGLRREVCRYESRLEHQVANVTTLSACVWGGRVFGVAVLLLYVCVENAGRTRCAGTERVWCEHNDSNSNISNNNNYRYYYNYYSLLPLHAAHTQCYAWEQHPAAGHSQSLLSCIFATLSDLLSVADETVPLPPSLPTPLLRYPHAIGNVRSISCRWWTLP